MTAVRILAPRPHQRAPPYNMFPRRRGVARCSRSRPTSRAFLSRVTLGKGAADKGLTASCFEPSHGARPRACREHSNLEDPTQLDLT